MRTKNRSETKSSAAIQISRRVALKVLGGSLASILISRSRTAAAELADRPLVGAIRWDAWYAPGSVPTKAVERSLSPEKYRFRSPFFAELSAGVSFPAMSEEEMEKEIDQAVFAGIDYWAFVAYGADHPMSKALYRFRAGRSADKLKYCLFTELDRWGTQNKPSPLLEEHARLMEDSNYLCVHGDRPLYYLGFLSKKNVQQRWGSPAGLKSQIDAFRNRIVQSGCGNPYIVLAGVPDFLKTEAHNLGGDALGSYAARAGGRRGSFTDLAKVAEHEWDDLASSGLPVVPTVMTGWDRRPRVENPVPWESSQAPGAGVEDFFQPPTEDELASHLRRSFRWISERQRERRAPAVLIYAWNENDEGGWLIPTWPCNVERLQTLRRVLKPNAAEVKKHLC